LNRTRPLKVVLVTSSYNFIKDGVALTLNRLVAYLEREGVEVLVVAPVAAQPAFDHIGTVVAVPSLPLPARPEYRLALGLPRRVQQRLAAFKPDIVHIAAPDLLGYRALHLARRWRLPIVASYHTRFETYLKHYWYVSGLTGFVTRYLRYFYSACREVYVPSPSMAETLLKDGHKNNIRVWPRGVDAERFHPDKRSNQWRARYGIAPSELVILHVSRLVREKRHDTLVETIERLQSAGIAHKCVVVGDGPDRDMLQKQLPAGVFTGFLDGDELAFAYASSDIFVFPSDSESFGSVTLEAMASGLPCVCADATGSCSLVVNGVTGFLAKPGCSDEFAHHVETLAKDAALRQRMGEAARERSLGFGWDEAMARLLTYYRALVEEDSEPLRVAA
jgi:glycosyltransferase involved in cell wall biosynthesis